MPREVPTDQSARRGPQPVKKQQPLAKRRRLMPWKRLALRWSTSRIVDGLWIGVALQEEGQEDRIFDRVEATLHLIRLHDPLRYGRLRRDLQRVWVLPLPEASACYNHRLAACQIDTRYCLAEDSTPEAIAATIVHEATHARLMNCGFGYEERLRSRVESACARREVAFAAKLPDGELVRENAERMLSWIQEPTYAGYWTYEAFDKRFIDGAAEALRESGMPNWLASLALAVRALIIKLRSRRLRP